MSHDWRKLCGSKLVDPARAIAAIRPGEHGRSAVGGGASSAPTGATKMPPEDRTLVDLLILHAGALGDLALTLQLALRLPRLQRGSTIHLISRTDPGDLSDCRPRVFRMSPEGLGLHWLYSEGDDPPPQRMRALLAGKRVVNALGGADAPLHPRLLQLAPRELLSFDPRRRPQTTTHITEQWRRDLQASGALLTACVRRRVEHASLFVPDDLRARGRARLGRASPGLLIHPGSGGRAKCWPLANFLDVAGAVRRHGRDVCFLVGPVELERWSAGELRHVRDHFPLIESPSPNALVELLAGAEVFLSNDSGPAHLAALLGTPTVTIFGPTSPTLWRPFGPRAQVIAGDPAGDPQAWGIDPGRVAAAVDRATGLFSR